MAGLEQFSSFQIGKMLNVSRQAVNQWIDKGYMQSYRTPGGHRRVKKAALIDFLKKRNIPVPDSLKDDKAIVDSPLVYLVDDNTSYLSLIRKAFTEKLTDIELRTFTNGMDALVAIGAEQPELLLLDLRMPHLDGVEVVRRLRENELTAKINIIIVTAYSESDEIDQLESLNVSQIWPKDTPLRDLIQKIREIVDEIDTMIA